MAERQAGDPIPKIAMDELVAKTIKAGVITEHWIIDYPTIIEADHKDTTEAQEKPWDYREVQGTLSLPEAPEDIVRQSRGHGTHDL